jgi:serine/threonine protein kinase
MTVTSHTRLEGSALSADGGGAVVAATVIGRGPVAIVYSGRLAATGAEVAVKVFPDRFDRDTATRLERERRALAGTSVPSLLTIDAVGEYGGDRSSVVTQLCAGSLAGMLTRGALPVSEVLAIGAAVASALSAAHEAGVVHGGVTPHNVLFRRSGEPVLGDFGLALRERFSRDPMHALEYTAPETLRDDTRSAASDLYGLGAVLYAMLTGAPPFPRRTGQAPGERILRVLRDPVPPIQAIPNELSELVSLLLAKDPAARPADAARVSAWFDHVRGGRSTAVPPALNPLVPPAPHPDTDFDSFARRQEMAPQAYMPLPQHAPAFPPQQPFPTPQPPQNQSTQPPAAPQPFAAPQPPLSQPTHPPAAQPPSPPQAAQPPVAQPLSPAPTPQPPVAQPLSPPPTPQPSAAQPFSPAPPVQPSVAQPFSPAPHVQPSVAQLPLAPLPTAQSPVAQPPVAQSPVGQPSLEATAPQPGFSEAPQAFSPTPGRTLIYTAGGQNEDTSRKPAGRWKIVAVAGALVVAVGVTAAILVIGGGDDDGAQGNPPPTTTAAPPTTESSAQRDIGLAVTKVEDLGDRVDLTWEADGDLDFSVVVAGDKVDTMVLVANRKRAMSVPVDKGRKYCFQIRATDSRDIFTSDPVPIRGARCAL